MAPGAAFLGRRRSQVGRLLTVDQSLQLAASDGPHLFPLSPACQAQRNVASAPETGLT